MAVNVGQLTQTANALSAIDWTQVASMNLDDFASDTVLAEDILSVVAVFWPPAALLAEALAIALVIEPLIAAAGVHISPDPDPEVDAQLAHGHGGRS